MNIEELGLSKRELEIYNGTSGHTEAERQKHIRMWEQRASGKRIGPPAPRQPSGEVRSVRKVRNITTQRSKSYLINMASRPERLEQSLSEFARAGMDAPEVFVAIDGAAVEKPAGWPDKCSAGCLGCLYSHRDVIAKAIAEELDYVIVYEDDVILCNGFKEKLNDLMESLPRNWDAVFIGGQWKSSPEATAQAGLLRVSGKDGIHRTHGYIVAKKYMPELLKMWSTEHGHCDHIWGRHQYKAEVYGVDPFLCGQREGESTIRQFNKHQPERWWTRKPQKLAQFKARTTAITKRGCGCGKRKA